MYSRLAHADHPAVPARFLRRALLALSILRTESLRSEELARRLDDRPRTIERLFVTLRDMGEWFRAHGLPWWEVVTSVRGRERWYRIVDHEAERQSRRKDGSHD